MPGKIAPKPVTLPSAPARPAAGDRPAEGARIGGTARLVAKGGGFFAEIELETGARFERRVYVADEAAARAQLVHMLDECGKAEKIDHDRGQRLRERKATRERRIARLVERVARQEPSPKPGRDALLIFLLQHRADEWLPPSDWPRPSEDEPDEVAREEADEGLGVWRALLFEQQLRAWRPEATDAEITEEVMIARPWRKRAGKGGTFAAAAGVFYYLLGVKRDHETLALVYDLATHATIWNPPPGPKGVGEKARFIRTTLKTARPRETDHALRLSRLEHADRMFDWHAVGLDEADERQSAEVASRKATARSVPT